MQYSIKITILTKISEEKEFVEGKYKLYTIYKKNIFVREIF